MQRPRGPQSGFTLMELMIVVAIVAVVASILIGVNSRTYGANSRTVSEQLAANLNAVRSRAIATRRIHRAFVRTSEIQVWASDSTGLIDDNDPSNDAFVMRIAIPSGVRVWNVDASSAATNPSENTTLDVEVKFKPDGSSSGGTIFLFDTNASKYRLPIYKFTGSVFARAGW